MENYIEYLNYAIKYSYEEFFEKGFKNSGLLENWLTYNLFHLYNFGDANRFAPKYIKYLKENCENNKENMLTFFITNYVRDIQNKQDEELVGPLEKIIHCIVEEKGLEETTKITRKYMKLEKDEKKSWIKEYLELEESSNQENSIEELETENINDEEIEIKKYFASVVKKYVNNLNVEDKDIEAEEFLDSIFYKYSKPDILKMMCAIIVKNSVKNPTLNIVDLAKYDDETKSVFVPSEFAVVANYTYPPSYIEMLTDAMEAIRDYQSKPKDTPEEEIEQ